MSVWVRAAGDVSGWVRATGAGGVSRCGGIPQCGLHLHLEWLPGKDVQVKMGPRRVLHDLLHGNVSIKRKMFIRYELRI